MWSGGFAPLKLNGDPEVVGFTRFYGANLAQTFTLVNLTDSPKEVHFSTDAFDGIETYEHVEVITTEPKRSPQFELWSGGVSVRLRANEGLLFIAKG